MRNLLIVDDELPAIHALEFIIDKKKLGIGEIYTAINITTAKEIILREKVDLLICDIEMPNGSGFDLLTWLQEQNIETQNIIATCHEDFSYAKKAIHLGSVDYLLKPVLPDELEAVLKRASERLMVREKASEFNKNIHALEKNRWLEKEKVWEQILNDRYVDIKELKKKHSFINGNSEYILVIIHRNKERFNDMNMESEVREFIFRNFLSELIAVDIQTPLILNLSEDRTAVVLTAADKADFSKDFIKERCDRFLAVCQQYLELVCTCYYSHPVNLEEIYLTVEKLHELQRENVLYIQEAVPRDKKMPHAEKYVFPYKDMWIDLLMEEKDEVLKAKIADYLDELKFKKQFDIRILHQFTTEFLQIIHFVMYKKGMNAKHWLNDDKDANILETTPAYWLDLKNWALQITDLLVKELREERAAQSLVEKIQNYIRSNYDKKITREDIADYLGFNCEYLSRLFKKETGILLSDYILTHKMNRAKELLLHTKTTVSDISIQVGYDNFSNFTRLFKKLEGVTPSEFRKSSLKES